jgi:hypothetical protein
MAGSASSHRLHSSAPDLLRRFGCRLWKKALLTFNAALDGYEVNISEQQLKGAPKFSKYEILTGPTAPVAARSMTITA